MINFTFYLNVFQIYIEHICEIIVFYSTKLLYLNIFECNTVLGMLFIFYLFIYFVKFYRNSIRTFYLFNYKKIFIVLLVYLILYSQNVENNIFSSSVLLINMNDNYKELTSMYKNLLDVSLYNNISKYDNLKDLENDYKNIIEYKELRKIVDDINRHEYIFIQIKKDEDVNTKNNEKHMTEYGDFALLIENELIKNNSVKKLNKEQYENINEFLNVLNFIKNKAMIYSDIKYYNSDEFIFLLRNNKIGSKMLIDSENVNEYKKNNIEFKKYIFARISDFTLTEDKNVSKNLHLKKKIVNIEKNNNHFYNTDKINFEIDSDLNLNLKNNMLGTVSTFFTEETLFFDNIMNILHSKDNDEQKMIFLNFLINKLKLNGIFIIFKEINPNFNRILFNDNNDKKDHKQSTKFGINILSLDDLCLLMFTLNNFKLNNHMDVIKLDTFNTKSENAIPMESLKKDILNERNMGIRNFYKKLCQNIDLKNGLFIFIDLTWSNILESMYKYSIELSGGLTVKRHMLNHLELSLSLFLNKIDPEMDIYLNTVKSFNTKKDNYSTKINKTNIVKEQIPMTSLFLLMTKLINDNMTLGHIDFIKNSRNLNIYQKTCLTQFFNNNMEDSKYYFNGLYYALNLYLYFRTFKLEEMESASLFQNNLDLDKHYKIRLQEMNSNTLESINNNLPKKKSMQTPILERKKNRTVYLMKTFKNNHRKYSTHTEKENKLITTTENIIYDHIQDEDINLNLEDNQLNQLINNHLPVMEDVLSELDNTIINENKLKFEKEGGENDSLNNIYFQNISKILIEFSDNPKKAQFEIEHNWINLVLNNMKQLEGNVLRSKKNYIIGEAFKTLEIPKKKKELNSHFGNIGKHLIDKKFIFITLSLLIENYKKSNQTYIAYLIGSNILYYIYKYLDKYKDKYNGFNQFLLFEVIDDLNINRKEKTSIKQEFNTIMQHDQDEQFDAKYINQKNRFCVQLGLSFMNIFLSEPISMFYLDYDEKDYFNMLNKPLKLLLNNQYLDTVLQNYIIRPKNLPMVCEPNEWSENSFGGFLENSLIKENVITGSMTFNKHKFKGKGLELLHRTINYFNKIKFKINIELLEYLENEGLFLFKNMDETDIFNSKISLSIAKIYQNRPIYLNMHADWRGRIYTHSFYITYQGSDLASSLLQFWSGFPLTQEGLINLKLYGASVYSSELNKKIKEDKLNWIDQNYDQILTLNPDFLKKAGSPFVFVAFCLELIKYEKNKDAIISLPVFIDATCSGIQHLSAMVGDYELGKEVNLTDNNNEINDIYQKLVIPINKALNNYGQNNPEFKNLSHIKLTRKDIKTPIMTQNYNVSIYGMKEQLFSALKEPQEVINELDDNSQQTKVKGKTKNKYIIKALSHSGEFILLNNKDLFKIAMIIKQVIFKEFPVLKDIYQYFIDIAVLMNKLKLPIQWVTPIGAEITQDYVKTTKNKIITYANKKAKVNIIKEVTDVRSNVKQKDGIIPNVIHSLDASHIIKLIIESSNNIPAPILTIHDCFGTHPNFIDILFFRIKEEFISLYIDNKFYKLFEKRIIQNIKDNNYNITHNNGQCFIIIDELNVLTMPKLKLKNTLELKSISRSKYMLT